MKIDWWYLPVAAAGIGTVAFLAARKARAAAPIPAGPLRPPPPPPGAEPPGPSARRIQEFIDQLSDAEVAGLRAAMPSHWWNFITMAVQMPDDEGVTFVFIPVQADYSLMNEAQRDELEDSVVDAVGYLNALELSNILVEVGVIPA